MTSISGDKFGLKTLKTVSLEDCHKCKISAMIMILRYLVRSLRSNLYENFKSFEPKLKKLGSTNGQKIGKTGAFSKICLLKMSHKG